jgi:hypothetical protein
MAMLENLPKRVFGPDTEGRYWKLVSFFSADGPSDICLVPVEEPTAESPSRSASLNYYMGCGSFCDYYEMTRERLLGVGVPEEQLERSRYLFHIGW